MRPKLDPKNAEGVAEQVKDDFKEVVLSARQDDFFRRNQHSNFGDLGTAIKVCQNSFCSCN